jgi:hypothetical protein
LKVGTGVKVAGSAIGNRKPKTPLTDCPLPIDRLPDFPIADSWLASIPYTTFNALKQKGIEPNECDEPAVPRPGRARRL